MRLFLDSTNCLLGLRLFGSALGALALLSPAQATQANAPSPQTEPQLSDLQRSLAIEATGGSDEILLSEADDVPDAMIEEDLPPIQVQPGTADGFIDEVIIESSPATLPPLVEDSFGDSLQLSIEPSESATVAADGLSTISLKGAITQADGSLIQQDVVVTLTATAGEFIGADYDIDQAGFQVLARLGEFEAQLRSSLDAQRVRVRASADPEEILGSAADEQLADIAELQDYTEVRFSTADRPPIVAGALNLRIGPATTDLWDSYREFLNPDQMGDTEFDLTASFFATGNVGDWLLTAAYNSERALNERCDGNRLYRDVQSCEQAYPVYGDSSTTDFLTPSIDSVFVRLERDSAVPDAVSDYIMWGDYGTDEFSQFSQEFSAITRQLHGFKGNYTFGDGLQLTGLYANNIRPFQRDTIAPDGTSGYYFLSRRLVLPGSEDIFIETEELNRPGTVVERVRLSRNADYQIDYDRGTILFTRPIAAVDANPFGPALVRRIVATYQVDGEEVGGSLYGARAQYNFSYDLESPSWLGATLLREDQGATDFSLFGVDALVSLGDDAQLVAELARSSMDTTVGNSDGIAYRVEATGQITPDVGGTAYFRSTESGFRNNASSSFQPGQTRYGGRIGANLGDTTQVQFQVDREVNEGPVTDLVANPGLVNFDTLFNPGLQRASVDGLVDNSLTTVSAGLQQQLGALTANLDWTYRDRDDDINNLGFSSHQLGAGLTWPLADNVTFRAQTDISLGSNEDPLFPGQTAFGVDWDVLPELVTLRLAQRFFHDTTVAPSSLTTLDTLINYDLTDNTALNGRYSLLGGMNGVTGQGSVGLNHRLPLAPGLHVDLGFERIFGGQPSIVASGGQLAQPYAVGQTAAALGLVDGTTYSVGLEYTDNPAFQASARFEHRSSDNSGSNTVLTATAAGRVSPSLTTLARFEYGNYANQVITGLLGNTSSVRLGLAYRNPSNDKFNGLLSYEYAVNPASTPNSVLLGAGSNSIREHTLAMEGIYTPNWQWEFYGKYALRSVNADLNSLGVGVNNAIHLAQLRAAYRFAYRWDILGEVRYVTQPSASFSEVGWALEAGYYMTPDLRLGVGYSFGSADDRSFSGSGYRSDEGPYLSVNFKVNELFDQFGAQEFDRQPVAPPQQQESLVEASAPQATEQAVLTNGDEE